MTLNEIQTTWNTIKSGADTTKTQSASFNGLTYIDYYDSNFTWLGMETLNTTTQDVVGVNTRQEDNDGSYVDFGYKNEGDDTSYWNYNYSSASVFQGGSQTKNGITKNYDANWQTASETISTDGLQTLGQSETLADEIFGTEAYSKVTYTWDGGYETSYFNAQGEKLGTSYHSEYTWTDWQDNQVTTESVSYHTFDDQDVMQYAGYEWSDSNGDSGSNRSTVQVVEGINNNNPVRVESGTNTWTWNGQQETSEYTWYYTNDDSWTFLGGSETRNGETTTFDANWQVQSVSIDPASLSSLAQANSELLAELTNIADYFTNPTSYRIEDSWSYMGGESQFIGIYNDAGDKLGTVNINRDTWQDWNGQSVTSTNLSYSDNEWNWLGSEWSDSNGNSGSNSSVVKVVEGYDGDPTTDGDQAVRVESGSYTWTWNGQEETTEYSWYYTNDDTWTFLGGSETRNGETTTWNADWTVQSVSIDPASLSAITQPADDLLASLDNITDYFQTASSYRISDDWSYDGNQSQSIDIYDDSANKLGTLHININTWQDWNGQSVTNTSLSYNDTEWNWLGSEWSDDQGNSGSNSSVVKVVEGYDGDPTTDGDQAVRVESGTNTWTWNGQQETSEYTWYYTNDDSWTFLGGTETRNGETTEWGAGWQIISVSVDTSMLSSIADAANDTELLAGLDDITDYFETATSYRISDQWSFDANNQSQTLAIYADDGTKLGTVNINQNVWTDWQGQAKQFINISYNDNDWNFLGSKEIHDGATTIYDEDWQPQSTTYDTSGLDMIHPESGLAYTLYGEAYYKVSEESNGNIQYEFYSADGAKIGSLFETQNDSENSTTLQYFDADYNNIGYQYGNAQGDSYLSYQTFEQKDITFKFDGINETTLNVMVQTKYEESSSYQGAKQSEWYYLTDGSWTFLGGKNTLNDTQTVYDQNWNPIEGEYNIETWTMSIPTLPEQIDSFTTETIEGIDYDLFTQIDPEFDNITYKYYFDQSQQPSVQFVIREEVRESESYDDPRYAVEVEKYTLVMDLQGNPLEEQTQYTYYADAELTQEVATADFLGIYQYNQDGRLEQISEQYYDGLNETGHSFTKLANDLEIERSNIDGPFIYQSVIQDNGYLGQPQKQVNFDIFAGQTPQDVTIANETFDVYSYENATEKYNFYFTDNATDLQNSLRVYTESYTNTNSLGEQSYSEHLYSATGSKYSEYFVNQGTDFIVADYYSTDSYTGMNNPVINQQTSLTDGSVNIVAFQDNSMAIDYHGWELDPDASHNILLEQGFMGILKLPNFGADDTLNIDWQNAFINNEDLADGVIDIEVMPPMDYSTDLTTDLTTDTMYETAASFSIKLTGVLDEQAVLASFPSQSDPSYAMTLEQ